MPTTWNPSDKSAGLTLSGGNLVASNSAGSNGVRSIDRVYTGKYYWEVTHTATNVNTWAGIATAGAPLGTGTGWFQCTGQGSYFLDGTNLGGQSVGGTIAVGWVCCFALDAANDLIWCRNGAAGTWNNNAANNPVTGVGGVSIGSLFGGPMGVYAATGVSGGGTTTANFGASGFVGAVPSGFTSGFPSGTTVVLTGVVTQASVEHWGPGAPVAQVTQTGLEVWGAISAVTRAALITQLAVEQWASVVPPVPPVTGGQSFVSVNTG